MRSFVVDASGAESKAPLPKPGKARMRGMFHLQDPLTPTLPRNRARGKSYRMYEFFVSHFSHTKQCHSERSEESST